MAGLSFVRRGGGAVTEYFLADNKHGCLLYFIQYSVSLQARTMKTNISID